MENVNVYSPIDDPKIKTDFQNSPIWSKSYSEEEYKENPKLFSVWFVYSFKFDGLKPKQVTNIQKLTN